MHITKMHGLGNDYIYLNGLEGAPEDLPGTDVSQQHQLQQQLTLIARRTVSFLPWCTVN